MGQLKLKKNTHQLTDYKLNNLTIQNIIKMTKEDKKIYDKLSDQVQVRGISFDDWKLLMELRTKMLVDQGEDPDDWDIGSKKLSRKI